jgi:hypothetical protein
MGELTAIEKLALQKFDLNVTLTGSADPDFLMMQGVMILFNTGEEQVVTPKGLETKITDKISKKITQVVSLKRTKDNESDLKELQNKLIERLVEVAGL